MPQPAGTVTLGWMGISLHGLVAGYSMQLLPLEHGDLVVGAIHDAVEMGVESGDAFGDGEVELVEVDVVAAPLEGLAVGGEDDAGDFVDGAGGAMVAGNPLRCGEAWRGRVYRKIDLGVIEPAWRFGEVGGDADGRLGRRRGW